MSLFLVLATYANPTATIANPTATIAKATHSHVLSSDDEGLAGGGDWKEKWGYGFVPTLNYHDGHGEALKPRTAMERAKTRSSGSARSDR